MFLNNKPMHQRDKIMDPYHISILATLVKLKLHYSLWHLAVIVFYTSFVCLSVFSVSDSDVWPSTLLQSCDRIQTCVRHMYAWPLHSATHKAWYYQSTGFLQTSR